MQFQASLFGLYYRHFEDLTSIEVREDAYFRGIHSNPFLTACVGFGDTLTSAGKVSRTQGLDKLPTMYDGRSKIYSPRGSSPRLIEVLGNIFLQTTDDPASFTIVDLPLVDLISGANGELYHQLDLRE